MMLQCGIAFPAAQCRRPAVWRWPVCSAMEDEPPSNEQLRVQLDQLRAEAEVARAKANATRMRLLRLTEAAENLCKQATISITKGKESDARDLLFQKKKIMQALEKSKKRIELLDKLSTKLHEAISIKESQLIGNVTLDLQVGMPDSPPVRIVSPKQDIIDVLRKDERLFPTEIQADDEKMPSKASPDHDDAASFYEELMTNIDKQLKKIEEELATILKVSSSEVDGSLGNIQIQQLLELLEDIKHVRKRVLGAMHQHAQA
ncbi:hypothetical protein MLD38_029340 [Melastoma candidum]|uniref:Uncharacterized protein n=1 Tax=Melastoma candidum TaxID=119954 RepID=A0ACB9N3G1_9MYRT|nr:hypothetical protein MLD38_029340 [Melastoma candidum]